MADHTMTLNNREEWVLAHYAAANGLTADQAALRLMQMSVATLANQYRTAGYNAAPDSVKNSIDNALVPYIP